MALALRVQGSKYLQIGMLMSVCLSNDNTVRLGRRRLAGFEDELAPLSHCYDCRYSLYVNEEHHNMGRVDVMRKKVRCRTIQQRWRNEETIPIWSGQRTGVIQ
jgi:hypothetical protein